MSAAHGYIGRIVCNDCDKIVFQHPYYRGETRLEQAENARACVDSDRAISEHERTCPRLDTIARMVVELIGTQDGSLTRDQWFARARKLGIEVPK